MKDIMIIIKKELARFFGDKRLVFTTVIMPGLMIYIMYTLMGEGLMKELTTQDDYIADAYVVNMPAELQEAMKELPVEWTELDTASMDKEAVFQEITEGEKDGLLIFPDDFMTNMMAYENSQGAAPNVEIYFNSGKSNSGTFYQVARTFFTAFEESIVNKFDVNVQEGSLGEYDLVSDNGILGQMMAGMLPLLIMTFIYSGCAAVAPESIAGEKERGTIATLLVTPVKRSALAFGKIFSLSMIALMAGISSFIGTILSLPKMMGNEVEFDAASYGMTDYIMLFIVIVSTVLLMVSVIALISAGAKSVKEATTAMSPFMLVIMLVSLMPMFGVKSESMMTSLIPMYNSVMAMNGIFGFDADVVKVVISTVVNIAVSGVFAAVLTKMFSSEKIMFDK